MPGRARAGAREDAGYFGPQSVFWRVNREPVLLLAGGRALLLQLAHPLVAAGVADHSGFLADPLARLRRTLDAMHAMIFGTRAEADAVARRVNAVHRRVRGALRDEGGALPAGTPYDALDAALLFWVHATLVDSALVGYESFVAPLSAGERAEFYDDSRQLARLMQVPESHIPATLAEFDAGMAEILRGPTLEITPTARRLADAVLHPPIPLLPRALGDAASVVTLGLLPPVLRRRYGFDWGRRHELAWRAARTLVRGVMPWLPGIARQVPPARRAEQRLAGAPRACRRRRPIARSAPPPREGTR